jgi:hypothetical protein
MTKLITWLASTLRFQLLFEKKGRAAIEEVDKWWTSDPPDRCATGRKCLARLAEIRNKGGLSAKDAGSLENLATDIRYIMQKDCP